MSKYRKKPVIIEAYQTEYDVDIETLEGTMHADVGDWIITGVKGEQYPCKPDIFALTYEPAESASAPQQSGENVGPDPNVKSASALCEHDWDEGSGNDYIRCRKCHQKWEPNEAQPATHTRWRVKEYEALARVLLEKDAVVIARDKWPRLPRKSIREALEKIANGKDGNGNPYIGPGYAVAQRIARAALEGKDGEVKIPLIADGYDDAIIGLASRCGQPDMVAYDTEKVIEILRSEGMTQEEAQEFFEFNILGSWVGETTPLFLTRMTRAELDELYAEEDKGRE